MNRIFVTRSSMPDKEEYFNEISDLWNTHLLTNMGEKHKILESELKKYCGVDNISLFVNGHMALEMTLQAMGLEGEVITTPFTFASTTHAIVRSGLTPVFCDIKRGDYTIDEEKIEALITPKTTAILPVHVYGHICNVDKIEKIADKYGLKVIYDAAHAFGEKYNEVGIGNFGDASMFSFHATKVFNTIEGGAVCYRTDELGKKLYQLKNFGIASETEVDGIGGNGKMNEFSAAMGICNLRHVEKEIMKRKEIVEYYREEIRKIEWIHMSEQQEGVSSNYSYFPIEVIGEMSSQRDDVYNWLRQNNIFSRKYFYPITSMFNCYRGRFEINATPVAQDISNRILTLPLYADLELGEVKKICNVLAEYGQKH